MAYQPKIVYDPGTGPVVLAFTYPDVKKPGANDLQAERSDSTTLSGKRQSIWWRTDEFLILNIEYALIAADMPLWDPFLRYAVTGGTFDFYPDAALGAFVTYTLDGTDWSPRFAVKELATFSLKCRLYIP